jgi:hypothetical protein
MGKINSKSNSVNIKKKQLLALASDMVSFLHERDDVQGRKIYQETLNLINPKRSRTTFVIPRDGLLNLSFIPKHESAEAQAVLKKVDIQDLGKSKIVLFVSHKWQGNLCDTVDHELLRQLKSLVASDPKLELIWIDYTCVPQDDHNVRLLHLFSIPDIMKGCFVVPFYIQSNQDQYKHSVWCQLEAIFCHRLHANMDINSENHKWLIYDWGDADAILPGFLNLFSERPKIFFDETTDTKTKFAGTRSQILIALLRAYLEHNAYKGAKAGTALRQKNMLEFDKQKPIQDVDVQTKKSAISPNKGASDVDKSLLLLVEDLEELENLQKVFINQTVLAEYEEFCQKEFSSENIMFFKDVTTWRNRFDQVLRDSNVQSAQHLISVYLSTNAIYQVNLSSETLSKIRALGSSLNFSEVLTKNTFDKARMEIAALMDKDSCPRFLNSVAKGLPLT